MAEDVRTQHSLFRWSRLLKSWLNCIPILERNISRDIVALERVSAIECVCHDQEGASEEFFGSFGRASILIMGTPSSHSVGPITLGSIRI